MCPLPRAPEGDDIREYWEAMTRVRLEFLKETGPVGTAIRVQGFAAYPDLLIEVEAIAYVPGLPPSRPLSAGGAPR